MRASYRVVWCDKNAIFIEDLDGACSITNDAEAVVKDVHNKLGLSNRKLYYQDTAGCIDQLVVDNNRFLGFKPCKEEQQAIIRQGFSGRL